MQITTLSFENLHKHGELFANLLRARHQSFIVQNKWNLPEAMGMEYDQYDTPASRWIAIHDLGRVVGGMRLTPTTAQCGIYSYMIRDAQRGLLGSIPADLLYKDAPVDPHVWEVSRGFVCHTVPMAARRRVHALMVAGMNRAARELGATRTIGLLSSSWPRWAARCALNMEAAGPLKMIDGVENQCIFINFAGKLH